MPVVEIEHDGIGCGLGPAMLTPNFRGADDRAITLQPVRTGLPYFGAALAGYVEATIQGDEDRNRLCPPSPYSNTPTD